MDKPFLEFITSIICLPYIIYQVTNFLLDYFKSSHAGEKALITTIISILLIGYFAYPGNRTNFNNSYDDFDYSVNVSGSSITIKVPYPSTGLVGVGITSLHVEPSKIGNDILSEFQGIKGLFKSGEYTAQLYLVSPDSYGGIIETGPYVLFSAQASELNKFENYRYFNKAFDFENKIYQSANR